MLRVENPGVFDVFRKYFLGGPKERQRSILGRFGGPLRALWGPLLGMLEGLWLFLGIVWVQNGARNVNMRVLRAILARVEVARGSQRLSMCRFWEDFHYLLCDIWYVGVFFGKKGFVHTVWYLDLDS